MKSNTVLVTAAIVLGSLVNAKAETPKTLFELSGVEKPQLKFDQSVLVIIDAQQEYETGQLPLVGVKEAVASIRNLLTEARKKGIPVVHVMHEGSAGGLFDPNTPAFKSIAGLEPKSKETVILKHLPDAFAGTTLAKELEKIGKERTLILVGFMTHMCISSTASAALDLGFQTAVVKDAVATRDLRGPDGETVPAQQVNQISLAALQDRISWIVGSTDLLTEHSK